LYLPLLSRLRKMPCSKKLALMWPSKTQATTSFPKKMRTIPIQRISLGSQRRKIGSLLLA
jgi:hypothetical protein